MYIFQYIFLKIKDEKMWKPERSSEYPLWRKDSPSKATDLENVEFVVELDKVSGIVISTYQKFFEIKLLLRLKI